MWGAVLGVLAGIMVGIYALPPILKHYYGEKVVAPGEAWEGTGKSLRLTDVIPMVAARQPAAGMRVEAFLVVVSGNSDTPWDLELGQFTLEFVELDEWQEPVGLEGEPGASTLIWPPGTEREFGLRFEIEYPETAAEQLTPEALHLSDPRVKFEVPE